jgi:hypothetical protein|tara:strand:- start:178 stop:375 length:198 start_codon:yes stop_codon:yes gene_type:complete
MAMSKNYKALLIRKDARKLVDKAQKKLEDELGMELNYSQTITLLCKRVLLSEIIRPDRLNHKEDV